MAKMALKSMRLNLECAVVKKSGGFLPQKLQNIKTKIKEYDIMHGNARTRPVRHTVCASPFNMFNLKTKECVTVAALVAQRKFPS